MGHSGRQGPPAARNRRSLTRSGRPRFALDADEVRRLGYLGEIGTALEVMFGAQTSGQRAPVFRA